MKKIQLWKNRNELSDFYALVDDEDYDRVMEAVGKAKWYAHASDKNGEYVYACDGGRDRYMHRVIMNAPKGMDVDHKNGDRLNNCKENLRICTRSENCRNKKTRKDSATGFKGVYKDKRGSRLKSPYVAYIGDPDRPGYHIKLGYYATAEEAKAARDKAASKLHGEYFRSE